MSEVILGAVEVHTTSNRGFNPEELADRALDRIIHVGEQSHPIIRDQAVVFRAHIRSVLVEYLRAAQQSERTTICAKLTENGFEEVAQLIGRM